MTRLVCRFLRRGIPGTLLAAVSLSLVMYAHAAGEAAPGAQGAGQARSKEGEGDREQGRRKIPPKAAIEACKGKAEGDGCSFTSPRGILEGDCHAGVEEVFACRPYRNGPSSEPVVSAPTRMPDEAAEPAGSGKGYRPLPEVDKAGRVPFTKGGQPVAPATTAPGRQPEMRDSRSGSDAAETGRGAATVAAAVQNPAPLQSVSGGKGGIPADQVGIFLPCLLVAVMTAGLTWYAFYRHSTVPLRRLRKVAQQLAQGDLSARVGEGLVHRKDEVADVGRDVDRMAERIERLVGAHQRLIRDVSHELRSPLARLNVALELARQSAGPEHAAPFDRIERESDRLNELIGQLLMLTKLEDESGTSQREDLDMAALLTEIAQDVDFEARSNDRGIAATIGEPLILSGNKELLRQALENIVRNAARYTATGTAVEISLRRKDAGGRSWAHIEVRDHGPGVPEAALYDIFRPFYRVSDSRERQSGGTGVGLAISYRAVRLHGGRLRAFNAPGGGLVMEMELPVA